MLVFLYLLSVVLFAREVLLRPSVMLRLSMWFAAAMIVLINGAATFANIREADTVLRALAILFPVGIIICSWYTPGCSEIARQVYHRCRATSRPDWRLRSSEDHFVRWVGGISVLTLLLYTHFVPASQWGLTAIVTGSGNSAMMREESLKLIASPVVRYSYMLYLSALAPFLACMVFLGSSRALLGSWLRVPVICVIIVSAMLTGARSPGLFVLVGLAISHFLRQGVRRGASAIAVSTLLGLLIATLLTILRQREAITGQMIMGLLHGGIFNRLFVMPFETGVWAMEYAETYGQLGIRGIRPLAMLCGEEFCYLPAAVAARLPGTLDSSNANTCFLFDFQACFGLYAGWILALVLICSLDATLYLFRHLTSGMLVACMAVFLLRSYALISGSFTTCLISHGLLSIVVLAFVYLWAFVIKPHRSYSGRFGGGPERTWVVSGRKGM